MSRKWHRSRAWDDRVLPRGRLWSWPIRTLLRALSSIWLAAVLLPLIALYLVIGSVPLGCLPDLAELGPRAKVWQSSWLEMTEGEFYAAWPLRVLLVAFVLNMIVATLRRIEFILVNAGVLTVHAGISVLALGAIAYAAYKQEGEMILLAGPERGVPGPPADRFVDASEAVLEINRNGVTDAVPLPGLPRYHDRAVGIAPPLDIPVRRPSAPAEGDSLRLRIVGYAAYADVQDRWEPTSDASSGDTSSVWVVGLPDRATSAPMTPQPAALALAASSLSDRSFEIEAVGGIIEHVDEQNEARWTALATELPPGTEHAILIQLSGSSKTLVRRVAEGQQIDLDGTGWKASVVKLDPRSSVPAAIAHGQTLHSSAAVLALLSPDGRRFTRVAHDLFPELDYDLFEGPADGAPPAVRPAEASIRTTYIDASRTRIAIRAHQAIVRQRGGTSTLIDTIEPGGRIRLADGVELSLLDWWPTAQHVQRPIPVPVEQRRHELLAARRHAVLGVEVSTPAPDGQRRPRIVWVPFSAPGDPALPIELDGVPGLSLAFRPLTRPLPGISLQLLDFMPIEDVPGNPPLDFRAAVLLRDREASASAVRRISLNRPAAWSPAGPAAFGSATPGVAWVHWLLRTDRFTFSHAAWDADGWNASRPGDEAGPAARPRARFVVLGVGNSPGLALVAAGGIMIAFGTPWALYVKPLLVRRRERLALGAPGPTPCGTGVAPTPRLQQPSAVTP